MLFFVLGDGGSVRCVVATGPGQTAVASKGKGALAVLSLAALVLRTTGERWPLRNAL